MSRILLPTGTQVGRTMIALTSTLISLSQQVGRLKLVCDQITAGGVTPELMEIGQDVNGDALLPIGTGATLYSNIQSIKSSLDGMLAMLATMDRGL